MNGKQNFLDAVERILTGAEMLRKYANDGPEAKDTIETRMQCMHISVAVWRHLMPVDPLLRPEAACPPPPPPPPPVEPMKEERKSRTPFEDFPLPFGLFGAGKAGAGQLGEMFGLPIKPNPSKEARDKDGPTKPPVPNLEHLLAILKVLAAVERFPEAFRTTRDAAG